MKDLGVEPGISQPEVSRSWQDMDEDVAELRGRWLEDTTYPDLCLDAT